VKSRAKKVVATKAVGKKVVATKAAGKKVVAPKAIGKKAVAPKAVGKTPVAPKAVGKKAFAPKAVGKKAVAPKAVGKKAVGKRTVATKAPATAKKSTSSKVVAKRSAASTRAVQASPKPKAVVKKADVQNGVAARLDAAKDFVKNVAVHAVADIVAVAEKIVAQTPFAPAEPEAETPGREAAPAADVAAGVPDRPFASKPAYEKRPFIAKPALAKPAPAVPADSPASIDAKPSGPAAAVWEQVAINAQKVAEARKLVQPGERFALTRDQKIAVDTLGAKLAAGEFEFLLKAPTGSGKTEVMLRVAIGEALRTGGYVCLVAPTRDLVRQDALYFRERLEGTGLGVGEIHGGISPGERRALLDGLSNGSLRFVIGSAMLISSGDLWGVLDRSALTIIDDVNAFDEREHLRLLEDLDCPLLFASATPSELKQFLTRVGAFDNRIEMQAMPFDVQPTKIHKVSGVWGEPAAEQLAHADDLIKTHLGRKSRIFVIGRTRGDVPKLAARLEALYGIPVQQLRGDMADSAEHGRRNRKRGVSVYGGTTRIAEMKAFTAGAPSILAATNLVGSGLDIPAADLIVVTDSDAFGESEIEQLIGRVGRREHPSDAVLVTETTFEKNPSRAMGGGRVQTFMPRGMRSNKLRFRR
jgi:hypothetical protein